MVKFLMPRWFLLREYCYFPEKSVLDFRFRLFPHKLSGDRDLMRIILPWEKPILQQFMWKNFYVVYCQSLVSNPARLSILTAYEIDPGYRTSVVWAIFVSLAKRVPRTSSPPWKRKVDDILSAVKASTQTLTTVTLIWGWFQTIYEVQRGSKQ